MRHGLTDEQWKVIEDLLPKPAWTGRPPADPRQMLDAILWVNNTGAIWRDIPRELGAWQTVFKHFDRWNNDGTLQAIVSRLTQFVIDGGHVSDELWCVGGSILRAHRCAAGCEKKRPGRSAWSRGSSFKRRAYNKNSSSDRRQRQSFWISSDCAASE